jgi:hypothetical protein
LGAEEKKMRARPCARIKEEMKNTLKNNRIIILIVSFILVITSVVIILTVDKTIVNPIKLRFNTKTQKISLIVFLNSDKYNRNNEWLSIEIQNINNKIRNKVNYYIHNRQEKNGIIKSEEYYNGEKIEKYVSVFPRNNWIQKIIVSYLDNGNKIVEKNYSSHWNLNSKLNKTVETYNYKLNTLTIINFKMNNEIETNILSGGPLLRQ